MDLDLLSTFDRLIDIEIDGANENYGPFRSTHEGYGVLTEEYHELRDAIHSNDTDAIVKEALQVAAVATRIALSLDHFDTRERSNCKPWRGTHDA